MVQLREAYSRLDSRLLLSSCLLYLPKKRGEAAEALSPGGHGKKRHAAFHLPPKACSAEREKSPSRREALTQ